jgi:hypothetical protein
MGHKRLKKRRFSLVETKVSIVEKNVRKTERFFDNHYKSLLNKNSDWMVATARTERMSDAGDCP